VGRNNNDFYESTGMPHRDVDLDSFMARSAARAKMTPEERENQEIQEYSESSKTYLGHLNNLADKFKKSGTYGQIKDFHDEHIKLASVPWPKPEALNLSETRGILRPFNKRLGASLNKSDFKYVSLNHNSCPFCDYVENGYNDIYETSEAKETMSKRIDPPKK
jgi:hypothetical protein